MSVAVLSSSSSTLSQPLDEPVDRSQSSGALKRIKVQTADEKMKNNFLEALAQHGCDPESIPFLKPKPAESSLSLSICADSKIGVRNSMEDAHFDCPLRDGHLLGLFDGHSEKGVLANQVAQLFKSQFQKQLDTCEGDIRQLFIGLVQQAQDAVPVTYGGTTALVSYFNSTTNKLYTATLGDSELKIYRKVGDRVVSIPVSVIRHWGIEKEETRLLEMVKDDGKKERWLAEKNPEYRRYPPEARAGLNVSRSIGEKHDIMLIDGKTAISRKPKVSVCQVMANNEAEDKIVLACDGVWHFVGEGKMVSEQDLIDRVIKPYWDSADLAQRIVTFALTDASSNDNVTAMVASVQKAVPTLSRQDTVVLSYE